MHSNGVRMVFFGALYKAITTQHISGKQETNFFIKNFSLLLSVANTKIIVFKRTKIYCNTKVLSFRKGNKLSLYLVKLGVFKPHKIQVIN